MSTITNDMNRIMTVLQQGGIAAIPTETVYGLAGNAFNDSAIAQIYALKKRPLNHPLIMHVAQKADLTQYAEAIPDYVETLIHHFWPGPLTLVLPCRMDKVNPLVTGGQNTVAIRAPNHPLTQRLLTQLDFPLVAPSANQFGKVSPTTAAHVQESFPGSELLILEGGRCPIGIESTIILATNPDGYRILRHGHIDEKKLRAILPGYELPHESMDSPIRISGNLKTHYQPEKPLYYYVDDALAQEFCAQNNAVCVLSFKKNELFNAYPGYLLPNDPKALAYELYYQLRAADQSPVAVILISLPPDTPEWKGSRERIMKAGQLLETSTLK